MGISHLFLANNFGDKESGGDLMNNTLSGSGPLDSKLWIIGDFPCNDELYQQEQMSGSGGKLLKSKLHSCGYELDDARKEKLVSTSSPTGKFSGFESNPEQKDKLDKSVAILKDSIKAAKPYLVLCLGAPPLKYLMGRYNVKDWRGHIFWNEELGCKVMCTYHPSNALRQRHANKANHPGQYEALLQNDIQKAVDGLKSRETNYIKYETLTKPTFEQAKRELERIRDEATILSYDIETLRNCLIDCIGFCTNIHSACCIPLYVPTGSGVAPYWESPIQRYEIFGLIKQIMESDIPKVAQNSQYDNVILQEYYDIEVRNLIWDTMVFAGELYGDLPKDLGTLISLYANIPYQKYLGKTGKLSDRWEYNATDALANLHIMIGQKEEDVALEKELGQSILNHYYNVVHPTIRVITQMQLNGVLVDQEVRDKALAKEYYFQEEILEILDKVIPIKISKDKKYLHKFKPGSTPDKKTLFYDAFGCRKVYHNRKTTLGKVAMAKYIKDDHRPFVRILSAVFLKWGESVQMSGRLGSTLRKGRMHTAYSIGGVEKDDKADEGKEIGTDTGRLKSKKSIFGDGTNLQNLKKGIQRQWLIPDEGYLYIHADQWAAEAFLTALDANEPELLKMLKRGEKIHQWMLDQTILKFPDACEVVNYTYKKAKQTIHGLDYNVQPPKMTQESGLPLVVTEWQYHFFHNKFPGIKMRMLRIENQVKDKRYLVSLLGRRKIILAPLNPETLNNAYAWKSQSVIGELTNIAMTKLFYNGIASKVDNKRLYTLPSLNTHDGLLISFPIKPVRGQISAEVASEDVQKSKARQIMKASFNVPMEQNGIIITIPIEVGFAKNFNDVEEEEIVTYE